MPKPEYREGPKAKEAFERTMTKLFQAKKPAPREKPEPKLNRTAEQGRAVVEGE